MDHELKQRLIGAVVVTALCAIFIPMLFDDPVDDSGQLASELSIPAPVAPATEFAGKLPASTEDVLKLPDQEPLVNETEGGTIESTGAAEELDEPEVDVSKQQGGGDSLYAESEGYAPDDAAEAESQLKLPLTKGEVEDQEISANRPKVSSKLSETTQGRALSAEPAKNLSPKASVRDAYPETVAKKIVQVKKAPESVKPLAVKKPQIEPVIATAAKAKNLASVSKAPQKQVRWFIQVGSFSKKENATSLWESLREQGLPASLDTVQTDKGISYRLRVGPELDENKAKAMKAKLDKKNINAFLMSE
ncbi:MAG: SPOR domain-containing protein [Methylococcaceae bacterium]